MDVNQSLQNLNTVRYGSLCTAGLFDIQKSYILPTQYISVFCVDLRTNSDYFPYSIK